MDSVEVLNVSKWIRRWIRERPSGFGGVVTGKTRDPAPRRGPNPEIGPRLGGEGVPDTDPKKTKMQFSELVVLRNSKESLKVKHIQK